jgi:flagellar biosynthesis/type III secretory pathway protein FliH
VRYQLEIRTLNRAERTAEEEAIMGAQDLYEQWEKEILQRGKALGLDEGKALGLREGKRELLLHVLTARFPELPAWVRERVQIAPEARLDAWAERVVSASCLEDVFGS